MKPHSLLIIWNYHSRATCSVRQTCELLLNKSFFFFFWLFDDYYKPVTLTECFTICFFFFDCFLLSSLALWSSSTECLDNYNSIRFFVPESEPTDYWMCTLNFFTLCRMTKRHMLAVEASSVQFCSSTLRSSTLFFTSLENVKSVRWPVKAANSLGVGRNDWS